MIITFLTSFGLYLFTMCPTVYSGDSGELTTACSVLGIAHPPGYPLYVLFGKIFTLIIPFGNIAYRINLMSAFFGALSCWMVYLIVKESEQKWTKVNESKSSFHFLSLPFTALITALFLAFSNSLWSQSTMAEVYSLNSFFVALIIYFLLVNHSRQNYSLLVIFLLGMGLGNHHTLVLSIPGIVYLILQREKVKRSEDKNTFSFSLSYFLTFLLFFILGFSVYLFMIVRSQQNPIADWDNPENITNFLKVVFRTGYGGVMHLEEKGGLLIRPLTLLFSQLFEYIKNVVSAFTVFGFLLGIFGLAVQYKKEKKYFWFLFLIFIIAGPFFIFLANKPVNNFTNDLLEPFYIPSVIIFAVWIGYAIKIISGKSSLFYIPVFGIILFQFTSNLPKNNLRYNFLADDVGKNILKTVPDNSILFLDKSDESVFVLAYQKIVKKRRPFIDIVDCNASVFPNIYGDRYYWIKGNERRTMRLPVERRMIFENKKNIYYLSENPNYFDGINFYNTGLLYVKDEKKSPVDFSNIYYLRRNNLRFRDHIMTSSFYFTTAKYYISTNQRYLVKKEFENLKAVSDNNISGEIAYIYYSNNFFDEAVEEYKNAIAKQPTNVEFYNNLGVIFDRQKKYTDAISMYKKAIEISPSYSDAHYNLAVVYWNTGNRKGVVSELEKVLQINPDRTDIKIFLETAKKRL
ncbi:MAG: DUF2723 domain-containing protein [Elusimicrobiota bacterium]